VWLWAAAVHPVAALEPFHLSTEEARERAADQAAEADKAQSIQQLVSVPCRAQLKNRKIVLLIGERSAEGVDASQERYDQLFGVIDARLRAVGLHTYSQAQIRQNIAQAEIDAYFNNDPDAALSASKRLAADYLLRGEVAAQSSVNSVVQVNQVSVDIKLTLSTSGGRVLSTADAHTDAYSGADTLRTALALVRDQADVLVARLYNDYCRQETVKP
jgi:hypothetical protein